VDAAITRREGPKDVFADEDEEEEQAEEMEIDTAKAEGGWTEVVDTDKKHPVGEEETSGVEELEEPIREVSVGKGLAGALSLLKERGTLKETTDWGGRNMDKKKSKLVGIIDESNSNVGQRDIQLDRLDEFGRMVSTRTLFSNCYLLHGCELAGRNS
jgi:U4/U6.U5 tri-snRNP-associated protein 1